MYRKRASCRTRLKVLDVLQAHTERAREVLFEVDGSRVVDGAGQAGLES